MPVKGCTLPYELMYMLFNNDFICESKYRLYLIFLSNSGIRLRNYSSCYFEVTTASNGYSMQTTDKQ